MQKAINEHVAKLKSDYTFSRQIDSFVEKAISDEIKSAMESHRPAIVAFVKEQVTDDLLKKIISAMWQKWDRGY
jgi:predicted sugar kinase